jgi:hypothetical protein
LATPLLRDLFTSEVGPDAKGSKPGIEGCAQVPEKSGMGAAGCACTKVSVEAAAINENNRQFRNRFIPLPFQYWVWKLTT